MFGIRNYFGWTEKGIQVCFQTKEQEKQRIIRNCNNALRTILLRCFKPLQNLEDHSNLYETHNLITIQRNEVRFHAECNERVTSLSSSG